MQEQMRTCNITVTWRGKKFIVEMNLAASLKDLGHELQKLTAIKADTMRLIIPQASNKSSQLLSPFSEEHSCLRLQEISLFEIVQTLHRTSNAQPPTALVDLILDFCFAENCLIAKGKSIRMMGVPKDEVDEVLQNAKENLRIAGFEEEGKRIRQRIVDRPHGSLKLPQGEYIFCEFRTLHIPGIELSPPASEALKRMHMLAADPGIVAIMNKHRWRVGIMTEMAPVGYVGVSPKCLLGFNKNQGEEISLRLRTDDLKGFRKYQSIKKTLLHELAHMVHSEHDANFFLLDKQLNQEAAALDWTRSKGHTLSGVGHSQNYEESFIDYHVSSSHKLGGNTPDRLTNARATSVAAAYRRLANVSPLDNDHDPDEFGLGVHKEPESMDVEEIGNHWKDDDEPDPDDCSNSQIKFEPDPDNIVDVEASESEPYSVFTKGIISSEPDPDDSLMTQFLPTVTEREMAISKAREEPDPDDSEMSNKSFDEPDPDDSLMTQCLHPVTEREMAIGKAREEPDPDDYQGKQEKVGCGNVARPDQGDAVPIVDIVNESKLHRDDREPDPDDSLKNGSMQTNEPDPDDQELQRIQDPVTIICNRLQKAIETLQSEVNPTEISGVLQTLFKIIRNVIEHPSDMKFKRIRKDNPVIRRNVANYKAAMEILSLIGFIEDVVLDDIGRAETYLVLKRNDPGLLWLAKSSLETCIAY